MTELTTTHPAAPAVKGSTHGGFADIARRLSALHPERHPFSRQLVARWYECREANGMPERLPIGTGPGKQELLFDLLAVERWHTSRFGTRAVSPPIETIPLFNVDHRGSVRHPADQEQSSYRERPSAREGSYRSSVLDL